MVGLIALTGSRAVAYEQSANLLAHQWITQQAVLFYRSQFGASEVDSFLGAVQTYPGGDNNRFIEGVYDEDVDQQNPFNQSTPYLNHFWWFDPASYQRTFDRGYLSNDSGANRAIKLFTGGNGLTAVYDTLWGRAQAAERDHGIVWFHGNDTGDLARKGRAYYWLGEAAHLLQDLTLPCHALNDPHPTVLNQDPVHDWVDGRAFAVTDGGAFDDNTARRWERWCFHADTKAVGRAGGTVPLENGHIRSRAELENMVMQPEWNASIPGAAQSVSEPLYRLFLETAGLADNFDSRDVNGQVDAGARRVNRGRYNDWTEQKVNEVADVMVPRAMKATAELLRYFYSLTDTTPPVVTMTRFSPNEATPTEIIGTAADPHAVAVYSVSGVDLGQFWFWLYRQNPTGWTGAGFGIGPGQFEFENLTDGVYRVYASVQNGAGRSGDSGYTYFRITNPVAVENHGEAATQFELPILPAAGAGPVEFRYSLAQAMQARLEIFAVDGRRVAVVAAGPHAAGRHRRTWNRHDASGRILKRGVYFARLAAGDTNLTHKLVLTRD